MQEQGGREEGLFTLAALQGEMSRLQSASRGIVNRVHSLAG